MKATIHIQNNSFTVDFSKPIDISIPVRNTEDATRAWYVPAASIEPVTMGDWVGSVEAGNSVNFKNIFFNPHAHGTHTECVGHISRENVSVNQHLKQFMFMAALISIEPEHVNGDAVITLAQLQNSLHNFSQIDALVIRTLPNFETKLFQNYSNTNPAFIDSESIAYLNQLGVRHLLIDTPSVDKEKDNGELLFHKAFWEYPNNIQYDKTITEFVFIESKVPDGLYLLNLQIGAIENDAAPSKPILYAIE
jgi:kynurenine formamidase